MALLLTPRLFGNYMAISPSSAIIILSTFGFSKPSILTVASIKSKMLSKNGAYFSMHPVSPAAIKMIMYWSIMTSRSSLRYSRVSMSWFA